MRVALAVFSVLVLAVTGVVVYNQFQSTWQDNQKAYFNQALTLAKSDVERAALTGREPKIEQTIVNGFGAQRIDRCTSCHIAVDDPRFDAAKQPLKTHPYSEAMGDVLKNGRWERKHNFTDFGCTSCHDGQGRGLTVADAHGEEEFWPSPMLGYTTQGDWKKENADHLKGGSFIQANCAQCHTDKDFKGTPEVTKGRELFFKKGCFGCHRIDGLSAGTLGPDLTEIGKERKLDYLWGHTAAPRAYSVTSIMPKFEMTDAERTSLVIFLKSRHGNSQSESDVQKYNDKNAAAVVLPESATALEGADAAKMSQVERGEKLIHGLACLSCHKLDAQDGGISPDLSYEGLLRDDPWMMAHFKSPRSRIPDSNMPTFGLPDSDYEALTAYLLSRKTPPANVTSAELYKQLCSRCHGEKGDGKGPNWIYLDPAPRDLTSAPFMNSKPRERFINSLHEGVAGTSMPAWGKVLNDDQINSLMTYVEQTFVKTPRNPIKARKIPDSNPQKSTPESIAHGQEIFLQRCTGCHGRKADGNGPNAMDMSPRPRNLLNSAFVNKASDHRLFESIEYGVEGTAMPSWIDTYSQNDVGDIINFIRSLNATGK
jgi:mono/diheme cytochrome c family protein